MLNLFRKMMPREDNFFALFQRHARIGVQAAEELRTFLSGMDRTEAAARTLFDLEQRADDVTAEVMLATRRSFITPFDRGDIKDLIQSMDDAVDSMKKVVKISLTYDIRISSPAIAALADDIVEAAGLVEVLIPLLEKPAANQQEISVLAERIKTIESRSDRSHEEGLRLLYEGARSGSGDALFFVVGSRLYDQLEKVVDSLEDVADEVSAIMIENV